VSLSPEERPQQDPPPDTSWVHTPPALVARELANLPLRLLIWIHNRPRRLGRERFRGLDTPVVFAANHASHLDTPVVLHALPWRWRRRTSVVAALDYFFRKRWLGLLVSLLFAAVPIERTGLSRTTQQRLEHLFAEGWSLFLFPEGTRTKTGRMGRVRSGAAFMAAQHGVPIVPVYIDGTFQSFPKGSTWPRLHRVTVVFGDPIHPPEDGDHRAMNDQLRTTLTRLAQELGHSEP